MRSIANTQQLTAAYNVRIGEKRQREQNAKSHSIHENKTTSASVAHNVVPHRFGNVLAGLHRARVTSGRNR